LVARNPAANGGAWRRNQRLLRILNTPSVRITAALAGALAKVVVPYKSPKIIRMTVEKRASRFARARTARPAPGFLVQGQTALPLQ